MGTLWWKVGTAYASLTYVRWKRGWLVAADSLTNVLGAYSSGGWTIYVLRNSAIYAVVRVIFFDVALYTSGTRFLDKLNNEQLIVDNEMRTRFRKGE